jgi:hypothetical protein
MVISAASAAPLHIAIAPTTAKIVPVPMNLLTVSLLTDMDTLTAARMRKANSRLGSKTSFYGLYASTNGW